MQSLLYPLPLLLKQNNMKLMGFPGGSVVKNPPANARDLGLIPGSERSPGGGNGNSLMFLPEESHDRGAGGLQSMGLQRVGHGWARNGYGFGAIKLYSQKRGANIGPSGQFTLLCHVHHQSQDSQPGLGHFSSSCPDADSNTFCLCSEFLPTHASFISRDPKEKLLNKTQIPRHGRPGSSWLPSTYFSNSNSDCGLSSLYPLITVSSSWNPHKGLGFGPTVHSVQNFFAHTTLIGHLFSRKPSFVPSCWQPPTLSGPSLSWRLWQFIIKQCHGQPICSPLRCELLDNWDCVSALTSDTEQGLNTINEQCNSRP